MNELIYENTLRTLRTQRNIFLALVFSLLLLAVVLALLLFGKSERIVVVPPYLEKEFSIEGSSVSASYLEQMGCFVGDLLLTRSPFSADIQLEILMRQTAPEFIATLRKKLGEELVKLQKDNASYVFFRTKVLVDPHNLTITLSGDRTLLLEDRVLNTVRESYKLSFINRYGRLLLLSVERGEEE